jgi:hypothetical protein
MNYPNHLTTHQEKIIIDKLLKRKAEFLNYGSSRVVFPWTDDKIVKIALTEEGIKQNKNELRVFTNCEEDDILSNIYAYGKIVLVCEKCDLEVDADHEQFNDLIQNLYNDGKNEIANKAQSAVDYLNSHYGFTDDNYQVGYNRKGFLVCLDYGFDPETEDEAGDLVDICSSNTSHKVLKMAIATLHCAANHYTFDSEELEEKLDGNYTITAKAIRAIAKKAQEHIPDNFTFTMEGCEEIEFKLL